MADNKLTIEDVDFLSKLIVGIGEVSQITNIPCRQIRYWEDKGIIKSLTEEEGKKPALRLYEYQEDAAGEIIYGRRIYPGCGGSESGGKNSIPGGCTQEV